MEEVRSVLSAEPDQMVKSVLLAIEFWPGGTRVPSPSPTLVLAAIPATKKLDRRKLADVLGVPYTSIRFASQQEVEEITGFKIGSIPPFGLPKHAMVFIDRKLASYQQVWCGTGKRTESLRIRFEDLCRLSSASVVDISKELISGASS